MNSPRPPLRLVDPWADPRSYRPDLLAALNRNERDLRVRQLRLQVHPPLDWFGMACIALSVFIVGYFAWQFIR
jgi:hypothetical protein